MIIENAFREGKAELPLLELDALLSGLRTTVGFIQQTVPNKGQTNFTINGSYNFYNDKGLQHLKALISRLKHINQTTLDNPEALTPDQLPTRRQEVIDKLEALTEELRYSRRAGLEEYPDEGRVGHDYKMTIRQYTGFLKQAGFTATGYFEGPQPDKDTPLDNGTATRAIALKPNENHAGGVWVIRAQRTDSQPTKT